MRNRNSWIALFLLAQCVVGYVLPSVIMHSPWPSFENVPNDLVDSFTVGGIAILNCALTFGSAWTLCRMPSEFNTLNGWPTIRPKTCGE